MVLVGGRRGGTCGLGGRGVEGVEVGTVRSRASRSFAQTVAETAMKAR